MDPTSEPPLKKRKIDNNISEADPATNDMEQKSEVPPHHHRTGRAPTFLNESFIAYYKVTKAKIAKKKKSDASYTALNLCILFLNILKISW